MKTKATANPKKICKDLYWDGGCELLSKERDGYYYCRVCGAAYLKPETDPKLNGSVSLKLYRCACRTLEYFSTWYFNDFFGYDCPIGHYRCKRCGRVYQHAYRMAPVNRQRSEVAKQKAEFSNRFYEERDQAKQEKLFADLEKTEVAMSKALDSFNSKFRYESAREGRASSLLHNLKDLRKKISKWEKALTETMGKSK